MLKKALAENPALVYLVSFSLGMLLLSLIGLAVDHRSLNGELVFAKPCKFSASLAIYGVSLLWFGQYLTAHRNFFKKISIASLAGTIIELSAIFTQVIRGTSSHFNTATTIDHAIFVTIILAIMPVAFSLIALLVMLLRERNLPTTIGISLQWGVFITIVGLIPGILMLTIHPIASVKLPYIGWSATSGDLRVAYFLGIHALQILPLAGLVVEGCAKRLSLTRKHMIVKNAAIGYLEIICLLTWQALRMEPFLCPGELTLRVAMLTAALHSLFILYSLKSASGEFSSNNFVLWQKPVTVLSFIVILLKKITTF